jgi:hypothetical protein
MNTTDVRRFLRRLLTVGPAVAMTLVSMALTLAVVVMWLGQSMPVAVALVVGVGLDGGWLATLAYERRLAAQGDHSTAVTAVGWGFGLIATGVLVAHALVGEHAAGAWLAVAWLPIAAKALWLVHGLWERTALTPAALVAIREIQQDSRDEAAVLRARLRAEAGSEETRLTAVTAAGTRVARVQARTAGQLAGAWSQLEGTQQGDGTTLALAQVSRSGWQLPAWGMNGDQPRLEVVNTSVNEVNTWASGLRDNIKLMAAGGVPQREIARQLGCSPSYVNKTVNG